jgi:hypothetical protein
MQAAAQGRALLTQVSSAAAGQGLNVTSRHMTFAASGLGFCGPALQRTPVRHLSMVVLPAPLGPVHESEGSKLGTAPQQARKALRVKLCLSSLAHRAGRSHSPST